MLRIEQKKSTYQRAIKRVFSKHRIARAKGSLILVRFSILKKRTKSLSTYRVYAKVKNFMRLNHI